MDNELRAPWVPGLRKAFLVGGVMLGTGIALVLVAFVATAILGTPSPSGGKELSGGAGFIAGLVIFAGISLAFFAVPVSMFVLVATLIARGARVVPPPPAAGSPGLDATELVTPAASLDAASLPPPNPTDRVAEPSLLADIVAATEANVMSQARPPMAVRLVMSTLVAVLLATACWTQIVWPMVGRGLFLDGVSTQARVISIETLPGSQDCRLVLEYQVNGMARQEKSILSDSGSCAVAPGAVEDIVYSAADPGAWRYAGLLPFPFAVVAGFAGVIALFWLGAFFSRARQRSVLTLRRRSS